MSETKWTVEVSRDGAGVERPVVVAGTHLVAAVSREGGVAVAKLISAAPDYHVIAGILLDLIEDCSDCKGTGAHHVGGRKVKDEACHHCGGVGEVFRTGACGEIGSLRRAHAKATGGEP